MKYTFSDEEDELAEALGTRRSTRTSGRDTPQAPAGPTVTASGRHVKSRATGMYGESLLSGQHTDAPSPATGDYAQSNASDEQHGRPSRGNAKAATNGWRSGRKHIETYNSVDEMDDEDEVTSWDGGEDDDDEPEPMVLDDDEAESTNGSSEEEEPRSLIVHLRYPKGTIIPSDQAVSQPNEPSQPLDAAVKDGQKEAEESQPTSLPAPSDQPPTHAVPSPAPPSSNTKAPEEAPQPNPNTSVPEQTPQPVPQHTTAPTPSAPLQDPRTSRCEPPAPKSPPNSTRAFPLLPPSTTNHPIPLAHSILAPAGASDPSFVIEEVLTFERYRGCVFI